MSTPTLDGSLTDWSATTRLDSSLTGVAGYALYGQGDAGSFYFAISSPVGVSIGANTTIWLDTDIDTLTGYSVFGLAGAEYNINIDSAGVARLYTGGAGEFEVAALASAQSVDGTAFEFALPKALLSGVPDMVRIYTDVNDAVFLPNSYAGANLVVDARPPVVVGSLTIDGTISEWGLKHGLIHQPMGHRGLPCMAMRKRVTMCLRLPAILSLSGRAPRFGLIPM